MDDGKRGRLVRSLKESGCFGVVEEERGEDANNYQQVLMAKLSGNTLRFAPFDQTQADKIAACFNEMLGRVPGAAVGSALVSLVKANNGTTIRQTGGLYWLPHSRHAMWKAVAGAVEKAAAHGESRVYLATMEVNADSIRVVRDAIKTEVVKESERLLAEAVKGELGKKALEARLMYIQSLEAKVQEYEGIVGESLDDLRVALGKVTTALGMVAFDVLTPEEAAV